MGARGGRQGGRRKLWRTYTYVESVANHRDASGSTVRWPRAAARAWNRQASRWVRGAPFGPGTREYVRDRVGIRLPLYARNVHGMKGRRKLHPAAIPPLPRPDPVVCRPPGYRFSSGYRQALPGCFLALRLERQLHRQLPDAGITGRRRDPAKGRRAAQRGRRRGEIRVIEDIEVLGAEL